MIDFPLSHRRRLAVTADDFGASRQANENIFHLIDLGKIDRVSVMVNGEFSTEEIRKLLKSGVKIDIHLDILHDFRKNRTKRGGFFMRTTGFLLKYFSGKISSKKVKLEWDEQIKKFKAIFERCPDGVNSHEHIHFFPPFFNIVLELQDNHLIPFVRFGRSVCAPHHKSIMLVLRALRKMSLKKFADSCFVSTDSLAGLEWIPDIDSFLDNPPEGTTEIVTHPETAEEFEKIKKYF